MQGVCRIKRDYPLPDTRTGRTAHHVPTPTPMTPSHPAVTWADPVREAAFQAWLQPLVARLNREIVDIAELNAELATTVTKINRLRANIDAIVAEIEGEEAAA